MTTKGRARRGRDGIRIPLAGGEISVHELGERLDELAGRLGRPLVIDWPTDRELSPEAQRLYAHLGVLVRFVPPPPGAPLA